jgi:hypothetical protein
MLSALFFCVFATVCGTLLSYLFDEVGLDLSTRLATGTIIGLALLGSLGFLFALLLGLNAWSLSLAMILLAAPLLLLRYAAFRSDVRVQFSSAFEWFSRFISRPDPGSVFAALFSVVLFVFLWRTFQGVLIEEPDGLYTGYVNNLGDLPFHLQIVHSFARGNNFPPEDPSFAGVRFSYPFMADFVSAIFLRAGASLYASLFIPSILLALSLVILVKRWTMELTGNRLASFLAPALLIFGGGLGWVMLLKEIPHNAAGALHFALHLPHDFTILPGHTWRWGNSITTLLVPQRSMLFGLPIAIFIFTQWWIALRDARRACSKAASVPRVSIRRLLAAGILAGLLPLIHAYTFVAVMAIAGCLALLSKQWSLWLAFFGPATLISMPELLWVLHGSGVRAQSFAAWQLGWDRGNLNPGWFWVLNTGLLIPILFAALAWRVRGEYLANRELAIYYAPFTLCFVVPNLIRLAPWVWDNIKVLFLWYAASVPLAALLLAHWWQQRRGWRLLAVCVILTLTLAGSLDLSRVFLRTIKIREFDNDGIAIAQQITERTEPRAVVLHAMTYDSPVFLTGRRSLLGYPGQIWSRGLDAGTRESDIRQIYVGTQDAPGLLLRYAVQYVLVGPQERAMMPVNTAFFDQFALIGNSGAYSLYKITRP